MYESGATLSDTKDCYKPCFELRALGTPGCFLTQGTWTCGVCFEETLGRDCVRLVRVQRELPCKTERYMCMPVSSASAHWHPA